MAQNDQSGIYHGGDKFCSICRSPRIEIGLMIDLGEPVDASS